MRSVRPVRKDLAMDDLTAATALQLPVRLEGIIGELLREVPRARSIAGDKVPQVLTAVDGSVVRTLASLAEAAYLTDKNGRTHCAWRFHTHFEIDRGVPVRMDASACSIIAKVALSTARSSAAGIEVIGGRKAGAVVGKAAAITPAATTAAMSATRASTSF